MIKLVFEEENGFNNDAILFLYTNSSSNAALLQNFALDFKEEHSTMLL